MVKSNIDKEIDALLSRIDKARPDINRKAAFVVVDGVRGVTPVRSGKLRASISVYRDGDKMVVAPAPETRKYGAVVTYGKKNQAGNNFLYKGFLKSAATVEAVILAEYSKLI